MTTEIPAKTERQSLPYYRGLTTKELADAVWSADVPEEAIKALPSQSLYMVLREHGLQSSVDLIEMATLAQCQMFLDLDLWRGDVLHEDAIWEWLALTDAASDLSLLQKILKVIDLKLIGVLIGKYVDVTVLEEATDQSPGPGFHTPDKGFTWIGLNKLDGEKHFLLGRLLALIFETSKELFYQLIATPAVASESMLEEESYQERLKRLAAEGIPESEVAAGQHIFYSLAEARSELAGKESRILASDQLIVEPLLYEERPIGYLAELIASVDDRELLEGELTWIMNSALVFFRVDYTDQDGVLLLASQVKGAINAGIEKVLASGQYDLKDVYTALGLTKLYRLGFTYVSALGKKARRIREEKIKEFVDDKILFALVAAAREKFPAMPVFLDDKGEIIGDGKNLAVGVRPIENCAALDFVSGVVEKVLQRESE